MDGFAGDVVGQRVAALCGLAPKPILLDVLEVDKATGMMKVKAAVLLGTAEEPREWWLSLSAVVTVAVIPKLADNMVRPAPSGIVLVS